MDKITIKRYPFNSDCAFIIGLDDLHPEGIEDEERLDFGKDFDGKFWTRINTLIREIPEIKITLFTPAAWVDRSNFPSGIFWPLRKIYSKRRSYNDGFDLNKSKYRNWVKNVNNLVKKGNIILAYHGLSHHNDNKKYAASQEFPGLSHKETDSRVNEMLHIIKNSGLPFVKGFRSPGWGTTDYLDQALGKNNFLYTANSTDFYSKNLEEKNRGTGIKGQTIIGMTYAKNGIPNFTANCYSDQIERAVDIAKKKGIIVVHGHIAKTIFGIRYVDKHFVSNIQKMVNEIRNQTLAHIWFTSFDEVAEFTLIRDQIKVKTQSKNRIEITNSSDKDIRGLTIVVNNQPFIVPLLKGKGRILLSTNKMTSKKKVSAILTVFNGQDQVIQSLESLCNQSYPNLEIIVVNDGSSDKTKHVLNEYVKKSNDSRIQVLHQKNGGRSNARNNGFKRSTGSIITFCEDDALYDRDYILNAVRHFEQNGQKLAGVIGPHYVWNKNESVNTRVKDVERRRNFYNYKPQSTWFYRRDLFEQVGRFDESLELVEDVAPAILLRRKGYHFLFEPESRWLHKEPPNLKQYLRRKFRGGVGLALLQKKSLRKSIVPIHYILTLILILIAGLSVLILRPLLVVPMLIAGIITLFILRYRDFIISRKVSNESWYFLVFSIFLEYIWWVSTFLGYLKGSTMNPHDIISYLKGR